MEKTNRTQHRFLLRYIHTPTKKLQYINHLKWNIYQQFKFDSSWMFGMYTKAITHLFLVIFPVHY